MPSKPTKEGSGTGTPIAYSEIPEGAFVGNGMPADAGRVTLPGWMTKSLSGNATFTRDAICEPNKRLNRNVISKSRPEVPHDS